MPLQNMKKNSIKRIQLRNHKKMQKLQLLRTAGVLVPPYFPPDEYGIKTADYFGKCWNRRDISGTFNYYKHLG